MTEDLTKKIMDEIGLTAVYSGDIQRLNPAHVSTAANKLSSVIDQHHTEGDHIEGSNRSLIALVKEAALRMRQGVLSTEDVWDTVYSVISAHISAYGKQDPDKKAAFFAEQNELIAIPFSHANALSR